MIYSVTPHHVWRCTTAHCLLFFLTSSTAGGLPLGLAITSDEKESTVFNALKLLLEVLPGKAFYGRKEGPEIVVTDDSSTEREALSKM